MSTQRPPAQSIGRQRSRSTGANVAIALFVLAVFTCGALLAIFSMSAHLGDPEAAAIHRTRMLNRAQAAVGQKLAGTPDLGAFETRMAAHGVALGAPVLIRIFKREFELEIWLARDGRFHRFETYPICVWSGQLGPKRVTGDKQAPEGFYTVAANQMNPNSRWHRSFNLGFPNRFDQSHGRTGSALMVHGGCSSVGCFAMTNAVIDEIWRLTTAAFGTGTAGSGAIGPGKQKRFQVQVFPFRMTNENLAAHANSPHIAFWRQLKLGSDQFEDNQLPPTASVCLGEYQFKPGRTLEVMPIVSRCAPGLTSNMSGAKKSL